MLTAKHICILLTAGLALLPPPSRAQATGKSTRVSLVSKGVPAATIVTGDGGPAVAFAASELQRCVREISGAELPIVDSAAASKVQGARILIGESPLTRMFGVRRGSLADDHYTIRILPKNVILIGNDEDEDYEYVGEDTNEMKRMATLCAAYELVARAGKFKWTAPGETTRWPATKSLAIQGTEFKSSVSNFATAFLATAVEEPVAATGTARPAIERPLLPSQVTHVPRYAANPWCESTSTGRLMLAVGKLGDKWVLDETSGYDPKKKNVYYFVNWDLVGTPEKGGRIRQFEVDPGQLYYVHFFEIDKPHDLNSFWMKGAGKACEVACVWVPPVPTPLRKSALTEVRPSPEWFYFEPEKRYPQFSRRFPRFKLPPGKYFSLPQYHVDEKAKDYFSRGVTHVRGAMGNGEPPERMSLCIGNYFNPGLKDVPSDDPHISPLEKAFMQCDYNYIEDRADTLKNNGVIFLDEEFWHNDYQPETVERLCIYIRRMKKNNPRIQVSDWWGGLPYRQTFKKPREGNTGTFDPMWVEKDYSPSVASQHIAQIYRYRIDIDGTNTTYGDELTALAPNLYTGGAWIHPSDAPKGVADSDLLIPTVMHQTRVNRRLGMNQGKPFIWFAWGFIDHFYDEPPVMYETRTKNPDGVVVYKDRLGLPPNLCEAMTFFGLYEGDGCHVWDGVGIGGDDPNGIFGLYHYLAGEREIPRLGEWRPDKKGTPPGPRPDGPGYIACRRFDADYFALGAWKYAMVADIMEDGVKQDLEYSLTGGSGWKTPKVDGSALCSIVRDARPIVVGAIKGREAAIAVFHPFQAQDERLDIRVRIGGREFEMSILGKWLHVYRASL